MNTQLFIFFFMTFRSVIALSKKDCNIWTCSDKINSDKVCGKIYKNSNNNIVIETSHCIKGERCSELASAIQAPTRYVDKSIFCSDTPLNVIPQITDTDLLHNEYCTQDKNCFNGSCVGNACNGKNNGSSCETHNECRLGSACINNKCNIQIEEGNCKDDYECVNDKLCDFGKCTKYYSKDIGEEVTNPLVCKSLSTYTLGNKLLCDESKLKVSKCSGDDDVCIYEFSYTKETLNLECLCDNDSNQSRSCKNSANKKYKINKGVHTLRRIDGGIDLTTLDKCLFDSIYGIENNLKSIYLAIFFTYLIILII